MTDDVCFRTATELRALIASLRLSCREVVDAHIARIEAVDPALNAIVTEAFEFGRDCADDLDRRRGLDAPLAGLPIAHKDLVATRGIRTTYGSPLYAEHVPTVDDRIVERMRRAGAVTIGKTNAPEFGAGSQTFNRVFGVTRNPYDPGKTCGGSSGGAAVALAARLIPVADGSDTGGSLRNPAAFCNVIGFRPSPGRIPGGDPWSDLSTAGPMARTVDDVALLFSVLAGPDEHVPNALPEPGSAFPGGAPCGTSRHAHRCQRGFRRLARARARASGDPRIGGPAARSRARTLSRQRPDLADARRIFHVLPSDRVPASLRPDVARRPGAAQGHHPLEPRGRDWS